MLVFFNSMCELASEFSETRIHANLCEPMREPPLVLKGRISNATLAKLIKTATM